MILLYYCLCGNRTGDIEMRVENTGKKSIKTKNTHSEGFSTTIYVLWLKSQTYYRPVP